MKAILGVSISALFLVSPSIPVSGSQEPSSGVGYGTVSFGFRGISMVVRGSGGRQRVEGDSGKLRLPVGEYQVQSAEAYANDSRGGRWTMGLGFKSENSFFRIHAGRETILWCGGQQSYCVHKFQGYSRGIAVMYGTSRARDVKAPDPGEIGF